MNNNDNVNNTVNGGNTTTAVPVQPTPVAQSTTVVQTPSVNQPTTVVQSTPLAQPASVVQNTTPVQPTPVVQSAPVANTNSDQPVNNVKQKQGINPTYVWIFLFVGIVLVIAGILTFLLLSGTILSRNRLLCSKTTNEDGYVHSIERTYKFDGTGYTRVFDEHEYNYTNGYTDETYYVEYASIIESMETGGITEYGFNTIISKKNNKVNITAYNMSTYAIDKVAARNHATHEGFMCEE